MARKKPQPLDKTSFDGIANKFDKNIYGTSKGQLRHTLLLSVLAQYLPDTPIHILDAGGGTGLMSKAMLELGHTVTLVDMSADALDIAKDRLSDYHNVTIVQDKLSNITGQYDVIICHAVLEWLQEPFQAISALTRNLKQEGLLSLSFFNHYAKVFNNLTYGNFDYIQQGMPAKNTVRLNPHNAQSPHKVIDFIAQACELDILNTRGIRCIHDYMPDKQKITDLYSQLLEMEWEYGAKEPYKWLGKYFHIMLKAR